MKDTLEKTINKIVGDRIWDLRVNKKKLKQTDLASVIDSSAALISNIEKGVQSIHLLDLYLIAEFLGKEVNYFLPTLKELKDALPSVDREKAKLSPKAASFVDSLRKQNRKDE